MESSWQGLCLCSNCYLPESELGTFPSVCRFCSEPGVTWLFYLGQTPLLDMLGSVSISYFLGSIWFNLVKLHIDRREISEHESRTNPFS